MKKVVKPIQTVRGCKDCSFCDQTSYYESRPCCTSGTPIKVDTNGKCLTKQKA